MKLYEYQAKQLFEKYNLPKPHGMILQNTNSLEGLLKKLGPGPWVIKAQILAGGRGKAGGVQIVKTLDESLTAAKKLLKHRLVTAQTGPQGEMVRTLLIEKAQPEIAREMYVSVVLDRKSSAPLLLLSMEGGMDIEKLAAEKPGALLRFNVDPIKRLPLKDAAEISSRLDLPAGVKAEAAQFLSRLVDVFFETDATLVEVNPWVLTKKGNLIALDGKINTDDNAEFRHPEQEEWRKSTPQSPYEKRAAKARISYVKLDGTVGCLVNGAGLAMATMDLIKVHGGEPANFLDVGGGANAGQVTEAFKIILSDRNVKGILVNIFGGIMRCDVIAEGILAAVKEVKLKVPLIVRLEGTNADKGKQILKNSKLALLSASDLSDAAEKVVQAVKGH